MALKVNFLAGFGAEKSPGRTGKWMSRHGQVARLDSASEQSIE
jgi:hypothetical protein